MITEVVDKETGAILFKKDEESKSLEDLMKRFEALEKKNTKLEKRIKELEKANAV